MALTAPPTIPLITDPATFASRAQDWVVWQAEQLYPALEDSSAVLSLSTSSTSTTSNTIGTGSKSFTVQTGKGYLAGQSLSIAYTTTPTNRMFAVVTSYNSGTGALVVDVQAVEGSGTYTEWSISLAFNGVISTIQINNDAVTFAKIQNITTASLLGRSTAGSGDIEELSVGTGLSLAGNVLSNSGTLIGYQVFTADDSYTKATNNPSYVIVEVIGGGGGGGGVGATAGQSGAGGGAGGYAIKKIAAASLGTSVTVTVGTAGSAASNSAGGAGGTSSFGTFCSATGGGGGAAGASTSFPAVAGSGGSGSGGDYNSDGGAGGTSAPTTIATSSASGFGGNSIKAGGAKCRAGSGGAGTSAIANSGGGGSGGVSGGTNVAGGAGGTGLVIVWEYS